MLADCMTKMLDPTRMRDYMSTGFLHLNATAENINNKMKKQKYNREKRMKEQENKKQCFEPDTNSNHAAKQVC